MAGSFPAILTICIILVAGSAGAADTPSPDVHLTVRTRGDQATFRIGEVIRLELSFTSSVPKTYRLDMASYDRSGRLGEDTFVVTPGSGWDDPLALYFSSLGGMAGGGLRGIDTLSGQPVTIHRELNEWVRFQQPGEYRVTVKSTRVSKLGNPFPSGGLTVTSNEIRLTVIPASAEWQKETLQAAVSALDAPAKTGTNSREAVQTLRYLGTPAAARELARRLKDQNCGSDCWLGLAGSPAREAGLDEMKRLLADPDYPVDNQFLFTMSAVALPDNAAGDVPAQRVRLEDGFRQELVSALAGKRGAALAASAYAIADEAPMNRQEVAPSIKGTVTDILVANFDRLPADTQAGLMESRWTALDRRRMLPLFEKVAQRYQDYPEPRANNAWQSNRASAAALQLWYEMDPAGARPAILREISRPKPRFGARVLGELPERELPDVELALVEHLRETHDLDASGNLASLIHRYGTAASEAQVTEYFDGHLGKFACDIQTPLLAYLLKVDPANARPRLERSLAARGPGFNGCNRSLLQDVARLQNGPVLAEIAEKALDDTDAQIAGNAAQYLGEYGPAAAESLLWSHLVAWRQHWTGSDDDTAELGLGTSLLNALATGQGWLADEVTLRRLAQMAVVPWQRQQVESYLNYWRTRPLTILFIAGERPQFQIAQYQAASLQAVKDKLDQFPAGCEFRWAGDRSKPAQEAFQALSQFAADHGMRIQR